MLQFAKRLESGAPKMKKTYEKPALAKTGDLTKHTAEQGPSNDV
jgi:hypothetical protein